jgi:hypothetical protein
MTRRTFRIGAYPDSEMGSAKVSFAALLNQTCYYWPLLAESHQTQLFFGSMPCKGHVLGYRRMTDAVVACKLAARRPSKWEIPD